MLKSAKRFFEKLTYKDKYSELEEMYKELELAQTQVVQNEKMATLGQLIAGVAHEINTPIGAIKASAAVMETASSSMIFKLMRVARYYTDEDLEVMEKVIDICIQSVKNMRSTSDLRRGKAQMRRYLRSIDIPDSGEMSELLARLEICDIEKIYNNMEIFRWGNIIEILKSLCMIFPHINSIQSVKYASDKVANIVFALKSFSHMNSSGTEGEYDIVKSVDNVLVLYYNQLKSGIEVQTLYDEDIPNLYGNKDELSQVWTNIIQNAIYAMSHVGKLTIQIKNDMNNKVIISFTDTGAGISQDNIKQIFNAFFTTKPLGEGSGLGLDICKKIIAKHDGEIDVTSVLGEGTTFTITLPIKQSDEPYLA